MNEDDDDNDDTSSGRGGGNDREIDCRGHLIWPPHNAHIQNND